MAAPKGNRFASHDKPWTNALQRVLAQLDVDDGKVRIKAGDALRQIAEATVIQAVMGDKDARKEIADRLDGRATEFVNVNHTRDPAGLTDAELADIATASRNRVAEAPAGPQEPSSVH